MNWVKKYILDSYNGYDIYHLANLVWAVER